MNPKTGLVSPQFHLLFDENFETVPHICAVTVPENWADLVNNSREKSTEGFYNTTKIWFDGEVDITADSPATSIPLAAMQQTSDAIQQPAAKQHPFAAMQQPDTTQQPQAVMQQPADMQPFSSAESPIFKRNSSAESPNLEDTANNDNSHIDFTTIQA